MCYEKQYANGLKNEWSYISSPTCACLVCIQTTLPLLCKVSVCILKVMMLLLMRKNQPFSRSEDKNSSHFVFVALVKVNVLFYCIFKNGKLRTELSSVVKTICTGLPLQLFISSGRQKIVVMFIILGSYKNLLVIGSIRVCDSQIQVKDLTIL